MLSVEDSVRIESNKPSDPDVGLFLHPLIYIHMNISPHPPFSTKLRSASLHCGSAASALVTSARNRGSARTSAERVVALESLWLGLVVSLVG